jgi:serine/threonine-protein kinase
VALGAMAAAGVVLAIVPLLMVVTSFASPGSGGGVAIPPPVPQRPSGPPGMDTMERGTAPGRTGPPASEGGRSPSPEARPAKAAVSTLARMRRSIDLGIAARQIAPREGTELATLVTTLLNQVDAGEPVDLDRRVDELRDRIARCGPREIDPVRAGELHALLAELDGPR